MAYFFLAKNLTNTKYAHIIRNKLIKKALAHHKKSQPLEYLYPSLNIKIIKITLTAQHRYPIAVE